MKRLIKKVLFGQEVSAFKIRCGLLAGLRFYVDPKHKSQRLIGLEERELTSTVRDAAGKANTAVDVGANDGWYTVYFATRPGITTVFACEPDQGSVVKLRQNLSLNPCQAGHVSVVPAFVGTGPGQVSVDSLLEGKKGPFVLKVDVDGGEAAVLRSAERTLKHEIVYLIVETHSAELERECIGYLRQLNYDSRVIRNGWYRRLIPEQRPIPHNRWFYAGPKQ